MINGTDVAFSAALSSDSSMSGPAREALEPPLYLATERVRARRKPGNDAGDLIEPAYRHARTPSGPRAIGVGARRGLSLMPFAGVIMVDLPDWQRAVKGTGQRRPVGAQ